MKRMGWLIMLLCFAQHGFSQDSTDVRLVLIGDAGKLNYGRQPVVDAVRQLIPLDKKTTVIFLGDNLYKTNLPPTYMNEYQAAKSVMDSQINIIEGTDAKAIFIPGNHDWMDGGPNGLENLMRQQNYIMNTTGKNVMYLPQDGCPGPVEYDLSDNVLLVIFDSQWFIQKGEKPGIESDCPYKTEDQFYRELDDIIGDNKDKLVVLACHHTFKSHGAHGGYFTLKQHIFPFTDLNPKLYIPLPVIGSIYPIARAVFGSPADLKYPAYANMINHVEKIIQGNPNVIMAAGHEHNLQLIKDSSHYYIVSGAGSKKTRVSNGPNLLYGAQEYGFSVLNISKNKNVDVDFYTVTEDSVHEAYSKNLFNFSIPEGESADSTKIPETIPERHFKDSVLVAVNKHYDQVSDFRKLLFGKNYRKEWATPVHLKVFDIEKTMGGFSIRRLGGGKQTKSLKLTDKNGVDWSLRTVDKDPEGAVPEALRGTIAQNLVQDMISAQHPYAPLVVASLADAVNVIQASPKYFFVPDDPSLGEYRQVFANKVVSLEKDEPTPDQKDTKSTSKIITKIIDNSKNHIDQEAVLRARLLDMYIGDYDRHFDQWKFGTKDTGAGKLYYPVPRDRDQAFFNSQGLVVKAASLSALPFLSGFKDHYINIKWFNWVERYFDRIFMNNLDGNQWQQIIHEFQNNLTDSAISVAVKKLPPPIYKMDSAQITEKLKSRASLLDKAAMKYYRFLAKEVNVVASNKDEYFRISNKGDDLEIKVFKRKEETDSANLMYQRVFKSNETKYINLYGLNGNDIFKVDTSTHSKIKLRMIGGSGIDSFQIAGSVRTAVYDYLDEGNFLSGGSRTKNKMSNDMMVNHYDMTDFQYDSYRLPLLALGYNSEDKVLVGGGFSIKTHSWRKEPYATYQKLTALVSTYNSAYNIKYNGIFNHVLGKTDLIVNGSLYNPALSNFFGFGNESKRDLEKPMEFYRARYNYVKGEVLIRRRMFKELLKLYAGPTYFHYWNHYYDNRNKILGTPSLVGLDSAGVYSNRSYAGLKFEANVNNVNNDLLPTRGVDWTTTLTSGFGLNKQSNNITKLQSEMSVYASFSQPARVVAVLHLGAGHIFNDNYEYFQALTLGANNFMRGFRKNRFAGQSMAHITTELRVKLFESQSYVFPGAVGIIGFYETGRVWQKNEHSGKWHHDFGGGLFYSPYNFAIISATIAHSNEENLFNFSIGTKFNLTF